VVKLNILVLYLYQMCGSIKVLFNTTHSASQYEIYNASRQFVRKISGFNKPSKANEKAFNIALQEISKSSERLLKSLEK
jgi:hypothetical protein